MDKTSGSVSIVLPGLYEKCLESGALRCMKAVIFRPEGKEHLYNHHVQLAWFGGKYYAGWSSGFVNEDSPGQVVVVSESNDGKAWTAPRPVMPLPEGKLRWTMGGFWNAGGRLHLMASRCLRVRYVDGGCAPHVLWEDLNTEYFVLEQGRWKPLGILAEDFYPNEPPLKLDDGGWMIPGVNSRAELAAALCPDPGKGRGRLVVIAEKTGDCNRRGTKLTEPTCYRIAPGSVRMLLRDDAGSRILWLTETRDNGGTWSDPVPTDFPDATSKLRAHVLSDGRLVLVSNPSPDDLRRRLLSVSVSANVDAPFSGMHKLCHDPEIRPRHEGMHKAAGFSYPSVLEKDGRLFIAYSVCKEDIEIAGMPAAFK